MIEATLPDPTVLPPSRLWLSFIAVLIPDFAGFFLSILFIFALFFMVFEIFGTKKVPGNLFHIFLKLNLRNT